jgi:outer membrane receptor protein involved in Fe transport
VAAADTRGLELEARWRSDPLTGSVAWTWLHTEVVDAGYDVGPGATFVEGAPLIRRPAQTITARAAYVPGTRARFVVGATLVGARADRDFATFPSRAVTLPAWLDLSAGAEARVLEGGGGRPSVSLTLRGENLLDRRYQEVFGFPAPGRVILVGARAGFGGG